MYTDTDADVAPHEFDPLVKYFWQRSNIFKSRITGCRHCVHRKDEHPVVVWSSARIVGDY